MKNKHGGKRKGAGRKKLAPTKTISFRVKIEQIEPVKELVKKYLKTKANATNNV